MGAVFASRGRPVGWARQSEMLTTGHFWRFEKGLGFAVGSAKNAHGVLLPRKEPVPQVT